MSIYQEQQELDDYLRQTISATNRLHAVLFGNPNPGGSEPLATIEDSARLIHVVEDLYQGHDITKKLEVGLSRPRNLLRDTVVLSTQPFVAVDRVNVQKRVIFSGPYRGRAEVIDRLEVQDTENLGPTTIDRRIKTGWLFRQNIAASSEMASASQVTQVINFLEIVMLDDDRHVKELPNAISSLDQFRLQSLGQKSLQLDLQ